MNSNFWLIGAIFLIILIVSSKLWGQDYRNAYTYQHFISSNDTLPYRLIIPNNYDPEKKYPLVVLLHGIGERGNDNEIQLRHGARAFATPDARKNFPAFVMVPQCPKGKTWTRFSPRKPILSEKPNGTMRLLMAAIDGLKRTYNIDLNRQYITGLSMGGFGAFDILMRHPEMVAAAAVVCGGADTAYVSRIKEIPLWMFHGADDKVVDPSFSHVVVEALEKQGATPKYTEYPGVGHESWNVAYKEPDLLPWLFSYTKK